MSIFDVFDRISANSQTQRGKIEYVIAGLGNFGMEYDNTRHNAGFFTVDKLAGNLGEEINRLKFKGKTAIRTFNFNCDVNAADYVLSSPNIGKIILVGKNVCHNPKNTADGIWKDLKPMIEGEYKVRPGKLQHDMLACREGLVALGCLDEPAWCVYKEVYPFNMGLCGNMTWWGSTLTPKPLNKYRKVLAAVDWVA